MDCGNRKLTAQENWAAPRSLILHSPCSWRRSFQEGILTRISEACIPKHQYLISRLPPWRRRKETPYTRCSLKTGRRRSSRPLHPAALRPDRKKLIQRFPKSRQRKQPPTESDLRALNTELPCTGFLSCLTTAGSEIPRLFPPPLLMNGEGSWQFPAGSRKIMCGIFPQPGSWHF